MDLAWCAKRSWMQLWSITPGLLRLQSEMEPPRSPLRSGGIFCKDRRRRTAKSVSIQTKATMQRDSGHFHYEDYAFKRTLVY